MRKIKYIMIDGVYPILFTEANTHQEIAGNRKVTSAGFVRLNTKEDGDIEATAYGESVSLKLKSDPIDSALITRMFSRY